MIKANELMVGNWVLITNQRIKLEGPKLAFIFDQDGLITRCEPIPLTPEILEKAGFEKDGFGSYNINIKMFSCSLNQLSFSGDYLYLRQGETNKRHEDAICVLWNKDLMRQFYLHQLQNLYFALTGEELEINL